MQFIYHYYYYVCILNSSIMKVKSVRIKVYCVCNFYKILETNWKNYSELNNNIFNSMYTVLLKKFVCIFSNS